MESIRFHLKEKVYRCLYSALTAQESLDQQKRVAILEVLQEFDVVTANDLRILLRHIIANELDSLLTG